MPGRETLIGDFIVLCAEKNVSFLRLFQSNTEIVGI
jgi:hypothetical protein